jgi:hypothetical protein
MASDETLVRDGEEWERLERMAGHDPEELPCPPDLADRIDEWMEESGMAPIVEYLRERMAEGKAFKLRSIDGDLVIEEVPRPDEASEL